MLGDYPPTTSKEIPRRYLLYDNWALVCGALTFILAIAAIIWVIASPPLMGCWQFFFCRGSPFY